MSDDRRGRGAMLALAAAAVALYGGLAWQGDLRPRLPLLLLGHGLLLAIMVAAWRVARAAGPAASRVALASALLFRVVMAAGDPALSDDVYRYVWDGRVQLGGVHPYRFAPEDPALAPLRDADWASINHPELRTIYPPLSQALFLGLASLGAGPRGFKLAMALLDFGVVLALGSLLQCLRLPPHRLLLYAWNPLAVLETAGSGHVEPLGAVMVLLAAVWATSGRSALSALGVAGGIGAKLLPAVLIPLHARRWRPVVVLLFALAVALTAAPYALTGPVLGAGLLDYAGRWERNAFLFAGIRGVWEGIDPTPWLKAVLGSLEARTGDAGVPWEWLHRHVWPSDLARATAGALALLWVLGVAWRARTDAVRGSFLTLGGVLLLSPTLHPWYLLWVLPFAAALRSRGWLLLAALAPLAYVGGPGDVPWWLRLVEYVPALALMAWEAGRAARRRSAAGSTGL